MKRLTSDCQRPNGLCSSSTWCSRSTAKPWRSSSARSPAGVKCVRWRGRSRWNQRVAADPRLHGREVRHADEQHAAGREQRRDVGDRRVGVVEVLEHVPQRDRVVRCRRPRPATPRSSADAVGRARRVDARARSARSPVPTSRPRAPPPQTARARRPMSSSEPRGGTEQREPRAVEAARAPAALGRPGAGAAATRTPRAAPGSDRDGLEQREQRQSTGARAQPGRHRIRRRPGTRSRDPA